MRITRIRKGPVLVASAVTVALALTACTGAKSEPTGSPTAAPTTAAPGVQIPAANQVGAMADFKVGTTFKATQPETFSLTYRDHPNYPVKEDWAIFSALTANQNVTFKRTDIPLADWDKKRALLLGSGDFPDLTTVFYPGTETQFVSGGGLLPISDYVQYMPNFQDKVQKWGLQAELDTHRQDDGKYYLLPGLREVPDLQYTICPNDDMWQKAGITADPKTWDEFQADLVKVKAANPTIKYAFSDRWNETPAPLGALMKIMGPSFDTAAGWDYSSTVFNKSTGKFELDATTPQYKSLVTYLSGLVSQGLLDPEITQKDDPAIQKFINGDSATISCNTQTITSDLRKKAADAGKTINTHLMVIPGGPAGNMIAGSRLAQGIVLNADVAKQPYFLALLQFVDWLYYSDEGIEFAVWGVQGQTYAKDASGVRTLNADINGLNQNPTATKKLQANYGFYNGVFMAGTGSTKDLLQATMSPEIKTWTNTVLGQSQLRGVNPRAGLSSDELESTSLLETQIKDAVNTATSEFITGKRSMSQWDAYVQQLDGLGAQQVVDTYNTAYQRTQGK
jgi:putative aldouronate transport system substrate-binding protein